MEKLILVKVGGKIVEEPDTLQRLLHDFTAIEGHKLLVHGGGRSATKVAEQLGIPSRMVGGRRITDADMLRVVTMVYVTGADLDILRSEKRPVKEVDYGFVGDVKAAHGDKLARLIADGVVPVLAPLTHDGHGQLLNTNADTIAGEAAKALAPFFDVTLVYCFEKKGVLRDENDDESVIPSIDRPMFEALVADGTVQGGMIPKLENAFEAISAGVKEVVITRADAILSGGTHIVR